MRYRHKERQANGEKEKETYYLISSYLHISECYHFALILYLQKTTNIG